MSTTVVVGGYAYFFLAEDRTSRTIGAVAVLMWYVFTYTAVRRAARLLLH